MAGLVSDHNHQRIDKSGTKFPEGEKFYVKDDGKKYVSRGGFKLEKALKVFDIDFTNKICLDIGASTGGFTDVALQNGAQMVYALDVGYNQLAWQLRDDPRVVVMEKQNFQVEEFDLLTEEIPENTQILMLPTPTTDYSAEEVDKLRTYLNDTTTDVPITLLATAYPSQGEMPNYAAFLEEWGVKVNTGVVSETDTSRMVVSDSTGILVDAESDILADNSYNYLVSYYSSPLELLFDANNSVVTYALWTTADTATVITENTTEEDVENPVTGSETVATLSSKLIQLEDGSSVSRSLCMFGSSTIFTDTFMSSAFGDSQYFQDLLLYLTANDGSNVSVTTERVQTNVADVTTTRSTIDILGWLFSAIIPVAILAAGLVIFLKRRHL